MIIPIDTVKNAISLFKGQNLALNKDIRIKLGNKEYPLPEIVGGIMGIVPLLMGKEMPMWYKELQFLISANITDQQRWDEFWEKYF